jgi:phosphoenolpyruvate-protein kinase (PTS system EI component)
MAIYIPFQPQVQAIISAAIEGRIDMMIPPFGKLDQVIKTVRLFRDHKAGSPAPVADEERVF